jgi:hypothetical protein
MMMSFLNKFKSLTTGILVLLFIVGVSFSSCSGNKKADNAETATESSEHPDGGEHPASDEHPSGGEHPSDSTKSEHPQGEHPK